jgi:hypothetical protein
VSLEKESQYEEGGGTTAAVWQGRTEMNQPCLLLSSETGGDLSF